MEGQRLLYSVEDEKIHVSTLYSNDIVYVTEIIPGNYPPVVSYQTDLESYLNTIAEHRLIIDPDNIRDTSIEASLQHLWEVYKEQNKEEFE
jgi:hypothetical protein